MILAADIYYIWRGRRGCAYPSSCHEHYYSCQNMYTRTVNGVGKLNVNQRPLNGDKVRTVAHCAIEILRDRYVIIRYHLFKSFYVVYIHLTSH